MNSYKCAIAIIIILAFSCSNNRNKIIKKNIEILELYEHNIMAQQDSLSRVKEKKLKYGLVGLKITSLVDILPDYREDVDRIIFIISDKDCVSCVECGMNILNSINKNNSTVNIDVIGITKFVHFDTDLYKDTVLEDKLGKLHKEVKFATTPIILVLHNEKIVDLHCPKNESLPVTQEFIGKYTML